MKNLVVLGGLILALSTVGRLLRRAKRVSASHRALLPHPLPPRTYTYKDVTLSLN